MKTFFSRNLDNKGRWVRGVLAAALFVGSGFGFAQAWWMGLALLASGLFVAFEAVRGWCVMRACGIKTKY